MAAEHPAGTESDGHRRYHRAPAESLRGPSGSNSAIYVAATGVLIVATKSPSHGEDRLAQVRCVTDDAVLHVINTHSHDDHGGGDYDMPPAAEIVVHENTAANLRKMWRNKSLDEAHALRTFSHRLTLFGGEDAVDLYYFGGGHTSGGTLVVFLRARVLHAGDLLADKTAPIINLPWGGDPAAYVTTMAGASAAIRDVDRLITGHGPTRPWNDFVTHAAFIRPIVAQIRAAQDSGIDANAARRQLVVTPEFAGHKLDRLECTYHDTYKAFTPW